MKRLIDQLRWTAGQRPDEVAYTDLGSATTLTFDEWDSQSTRLANLLRRGSGVAPGDRVALHLESSHACKWIVAYAAIHKTGAIAVPVNTRLTTGELSSILTHAAPTMVITSSALRTAHAGGYGETEGGAVRHLDVDSEQWDDAMQWDDEPFDPPVGPDDLADIMYTSGTTGLPKGIAVRHRNTHIIPTGEPPWTGDAWLHCSPLFTFAGLSFVYNPMKMGMTTLFLPRFDVGAWLDAVERRRPTMAFLVPSMVQLLLASDRFETADLSSLTVVSIGSAPLPANLHRAMADRLPGAMVTNNYSMTEAGTAFTYMPPDELSRRAGSVGIPTGAEIRIADDDGNPLPAGAVGEILVRVGEHHREYYKDPDATAATWSGEWLRSGDLGELDEDGFLYIRGRKKDMIIRGGNNVMAGDVEAVLLDHPAVFDVAVVPVPHDVLGEDVGAAVVLAAGADADADELRSWCESRLADYKRPRRIWFVDELPRNPTGKVTKRDIAIPQGVR